MLLLPDTAVSEVEFGEHVSGRNVSRCIKQPRMLRQFGGKRRPWFEHLRDEMANTVVSLFEERVVWVFGEEPIQRSPHRLGRAAAVAHSCEFMKAHCVCDCQEVKADAAHCKQIDILRCLMIVGTAVAGEVCGVGVGLKAAQRTEVNDGDIGTLDGEVFEFEITVEVGETVLRTTVRSDQHRDDLSHDELGLRFREVLGLGDALTRSDKHKIVKLPSFAEGGDEGVEGVGFAVDGGDIDVT
mmetsp:Transcript_54255/g.128132  ORF Transcript_54255/g.128132 Transcript_54255/m.128132 type:complete len:241 (+) Transcript_54255:372-1094(+)